jgi:hypothetical protein
MSEILYRETARTKMNDSFSNMLRETAEYFADKGISISNHQGMEEILSEESLFQEYKERLCEGMEADQIENFSQLMDNARTTMLQEATVDGIQQIAGLSMPTIRKMWAKVSLKHAIPTQVVSTPRFAISYTKAYLMDGNGNKYELPDAINDLENTKAQLPTASTEEIDVKGGLEDFDLFSLFDIPLSTEKNDSIDKVFYLENVVVNAPSCETEDGQTVVGEKQVVRVHIKSSQYAMLHGKVEVPVVVTDDKTGIKTQVGVMTDTIFGSVDYGAGTMTITAINDNIDAVTVIAKASQETNEFGESVSFDVLTKDVTIGVGTHLNAPLPIEWLQDTMAVYNIDGAAEVVDLMSQTVAQKLEIEIYNFLKNSIEINDVPYIGEFNMIPSAGYNGTPKSWREELKTVIDYYAIKMKTDCKFHGGKFMIIGSPVDMQIIPNVDWVFNHTSDQMSGVDVSFNLGAFSGANRYEMVTSDLIPSGSLIMFFIPGIDRLMTYKYYPYTFNVEKGYRDPNMPNVPSLMMTKRHVIEEFSPLICRIDIKNNVGRVPETPGY